MQEFRIQKEVKGSDRNFSKIQAGNFLRIENILQNFYSIKRSEDYSFQLWEHKVLSIIRIADFLNLLSIFLQEIIWKFFSIEFWKSHRLGLEIDFHEILTLIETNLLVSLFAN